MHCGQDGTAGDGDAIVGFFCIARQHCERRKERGFTYVGVMFLVVLVTLALSSVATVWQRASQREREAELLFAGDQIARAIESYYRRSPGKPQFPRSLEDLLLDNRYPVVVRHLRRIYRDPMTGSTEWGLVKVADRIVGVHSLSTAKPIKTAGFDQRDFEGAETYEDWKFVLKERPRQAVGTTARGGSDASSGPAQRP